MEVREAVPGDSEAIRRVHRASIEGLGPAAYTDAQVAAWAASCAETDYTEPIDDPATTVLVAVTDAVVGFGSVTTDPDQEYPVCVDAEVTAVYVAPDAAREGVGTAVYTGLEARVSDTAVLGLVASKNAVPFYTSHGYQRVGTRDHEFSSALDTGVTGEVVQMVKEP